MTPSNQKPIVISQAQSKRIEDTLCLMARDGRTREQISDARCALQLEFLAMNKGFLGPVRPGMAAMSADAAAKVAE